MHILANGNVEVKCKGCGVTRQVRAAEYLRSTTQEKVYCKQCIRKMREKKGRWYK